MRAAASRRAVAVGPDASTPRLDDARSFRRVTPKLGVVWRLDAARSVYASLGGGVEAPAGVR